MRLRFPPSMAYLGSVVQFVSSCHIMLQLVCFLSHSFTSDATETRKVCPFTSYTIFEQNVEVDHPRLSIALNPEDNTYILEIAVDENNSAGGNSASAKFMMNCIVSNSGPQSPPVDAIFRASVYGHHENTSIPFDAILTYSLLKTDDTRGAQQSHIFSSQWLTSSSIFSFHAEVSPGTFLESLLITFPRATTTTILPISLVLAPQHQPITAPEEPHKIVHHVLPVGFRTDQNSNADVPASSEFWSTQEIFYKNLPAGGIRAALEIHAKGIWRQPKVVHMSPAPLHATLCLKLRIKIVGSVDICRALPVDRLEDTPAVVSGTAISMYQNLAQFLSGPISIEAAIQSVSVSLHSTSKVLPSLIDLTEIQIIAQRPTECVLGYQVPGILSSLQQQTAVDTHDGILIMQFLEPTRSRVKIKLLLSCLVVAPPRSPNNAPLQLTVMLHVNAMQELEEGYPVQVALKYVHPTSGETVSKILLDPSSRPIASNIMSVATRVFDGWLLTSLILTFPQDHSAHGMHFSVRLEEIHESTPSVPAAPLEQRDLLLDFLCTARPDDTEVAHRCGWLQGFPLSIHCSEGDTALHVQATQTHPLVFKHTFEDAVLNPAGVTLIGAVHAVSNHSAYYMICVVLHMTENTGTHVSYHCSLADGDTSQPGTASPIHLNAVPESVLFLMRSKKVAMGELSLQAISVAIFSDDRAARFEISNILVAAPASTKPLIPLCQADTNVMAPFDTDVAHGEEVGTATELNISFRSGEQFAQSFPISCTPVPQQEVRVVLGGVGSLGLQKSNAPDVDLELSCISGVPFRLRISGQLFHESHRVDVHVLLPKGFARLTSLGLARERTLGIPAPIRASASLTAASAPPTLQDPTSYDYKVDLLHSIHNVCAETQEGSRLDLTGTAHALHLLPNDVPIHLTCISRTSSNHHGPHVAIRLDPAEIQQSIAHLQFAVPAPAECPMCAPEVSELVLGIMPAQPSADLSECFVTFCVAEVDTSEIQLGTHCEVHPAEHFRDDAEVLFSITHDSAAARNRAPAHSSLELALKVSVNETCSIKPEIALYTALVYFKKMRDSSGTDPDPPGTPQTRRFPVWAIAPIAILIALLLLGCVIACYMKRRPSRSTTQDDARMLEEFELTKFGDTTP